MYLIWVKRSNQNIRVNVAQNWLSSLQSKSTVVGWVRFYFIFMSISFLSSQPPYKKKKKKQLSSPHKKNKPKSRTEQIHFFCCVHGIGTMCTWFLVRISTVYTSFVSLDLIHTADVDFGFFYGDHITSISTYSGRI